MSNKTLTTNPENVYVSCGCGWYGRLESTADGNCPRCGYADDLTCKQINSWESRCNEGLPAISVIQ
jgi:hypothetical protein